VGEVPGYGEIKGTTDLLLDDCIVLDWKFVGIKKIKSYIVNGPPEQYRFQAQLYARGVELSGKPVESIAICFIPRDSGNVNDIYVYEEAYQPEMAEQALVRAGMIYDIVQESGWETLPTDDDCFNCNSTWFN
jgi:hypothetical protein